MCVKREEGVEMRGDGVAGSSGAVMDSTLTSMIRPVEVVCVFIEKKFHCFFFLLCVCVGVHGFVWECVRVCETCDLLLSESLTR